jgi:hypothetical protein
VDKQERLQQIQKIRGMVRANPVLRLELLAALSKLFRDFDVQYDPRVLTHVVLAVNVEVLGDIAPEIIVDPG